MLTGVKTWNTLELFTSSDHNNYSNGDPNYIRGAPFWTPLSQFDNSWTAAILDPTDPILSWPGYRKAGNWVKLRGLFKNSIGMQGLPAFTLPLGAIPLDGPSKLGYLEWSCWSNCPGGFAIVRIYLVDTGGYPLGTVWPNYRNAGLSTQQYLFALDGVVFNAGVGDVVASPVIIPPAVPTPTSTSNPPTGVIAVADIGSARVSWLTPADNGGSPITSYTITATPGGSQLNVAPGVNSATVSGLTNGVAYTFTVVANNAVGSSTPSVASAAVIPLATFTVPDAPTGVTAVAGINSAIVSWIAAADGGSSITQYIVTSIPSGHIATSVGLTAIVFGLATGTAYTFTVRAVNTIGTGPTSAVSASVTP